MVSSVTSSSSSSPSAGGAPGAVLITGTTSGVGLNATKALIDRGWTVVTANRDPIRAAEAADGLGIPRDRLHHIRMDLGDLESVRVAVETLVDSLGFGLDALVINAAVYKPRLKQPERSPQGYELSMATNHLGHFLLARLLLDDLKGAPNGRPRCVIVGSITGNTNTLAGNVPPKADLGELAGLSAATPASMIDGKEFDGAKAYKARRVARRPGGGWVGGGGGDSQHACGVNLNARRRSRLATQDSKVCNMLTMRELHRRYAESTGITFASLYPGCIAETGLFR